jgi:hypothetical protein
VAGLFFLPSGSVKLIKTTPLSLLLASGWHGVMSMKRILYLDRDDKVRAPALAAYTSHFAPHCGLDVKAYSAASDPEAFAEALRREGPLLPIAIRRMLFSEGIPSALYRESALVDEAMLGPSDLVLAVDTESLGRIRAAYPGVEAETAKGFMGLTSDDISPIALSAPGQLLGVTGPDAKAARYLSFELRHIAMGVLEKIGHMHLPDRPHPFEPEHETDYANL